MRYTFDKFKKLLHVLVERSMRARQRSPLECSAIAARLKKQVRFEPESRRLIKPGLVATCASALDAAFLPPHP
jgi:hypothetical protein